MEVIREPKLTSLVIWQDKGRVLGTLRVLGKNSGVSCISFGRTAFWCVCPFAVPADPARFAVVELILVNPIFYIKIIFSEPA